MARKKDKNKPASAAAAATKKPKLNDLPSAFPPLLLKNKNGTKSATSTKIHALHKDDVFASPHFLDADECRAWIDFCESVGMEKVAHPATRWIAHRECARLQLNDTAMADRLYSRMQETILPQISWQLDNVISSPSSKNYRPVGCNENLRLYRYDKGMSFGKHVDGSHPVKRFDNGNTEITVLIYLSSCVGGATRFYPPRASSNKKNSFAFDPQPGAILFHVHGDRCLEHEADPVQQGVKYVLRTDIVYSSG